MDSNPEIFTFGQLKDGLVDVRDCKTTGVVAFAKGTALYGLKAGKRDDGSAGPGGRKQSAELHGADERLGGQTLSGAIGRNQSKSTDPGAFRVIGAKTARWRRTAARSRAS
jgi:hypothetical protein